MAVFFSSDGQFAGLIAQLVYQSFLSGFPTRADVSEVLFLTYSNNVTNLFHVGMSSALSSLQ